MASSGGGWMALGRMGLPPVAREGLTPTAPVRVVILGEDALARSALADRLAGQAQVAVAAHLGTTVALAAVVEQEPDVVLWDAGLHPQPVISGTSAWGSGVPVLALADGPGVSADLRSTGVHGVLPRDVSPARLAAALNAVAHGLHIREGGAEGDAARALIPAFTAPESLTPREREVVNLLAEGLSNKAIGERLAISEHTAKFHVNAILGKLGASGRTDAVMRAVRHGLILV